MNWIEILNRLEIFGHVATLIILFLVIYIYQDVRDLKKILRGEVSDETMNEFCGELMKGAKELRKERKKHLTEKDN